MGKNLPPNIGQLTCLLMDARKLCDSGGFDRSAIVIQSALNMIFFESRYLQGRMSAKKTKLLGPKARNAEYRRTQMKDLNKF